MLAFKHLRTPSGSHSTEPAGFARLLTTKLAKVIATAVLAICFGLLYLQWANNNSSARVEGPVPEIIEDLKATTAVPQRQGRLHLLIPATSSNSDLCKLLLSAQILGWPTPVLINYGDVENADAYVQHLAKVEGILRYLDRLEASEEYEEDLVLIVDGYDIWFQLRPDVLIKRFYETNSAANAHAVEVYGQDLVDQYDIKQTIIFGPDKLCWPVDFSRPACWAVPMSPLPEAAFGVTAGAYTNRDNNQARWLNSGTVMGMASDLTEVFRTTLDEIHTNHTTDSDQFYFSNVFGLQEYARLSLKPELLASAKEVAYDDVEDPSEGHRYEPEIQGIKTEYHIGIDYASTMFQTLAFWKPHLSWSRVIDAWTTSDKAKSVVNPFQMELPDDIKQSAAPYEALKYGLDREGHPGWDSIQLVYNVITRQIPVLLHVTGNPQEKEYRAKWWPKLWFQASAEQLRLASNKLESREISPEPIAGIHWFNAEPEDAEEIVGAGKGGAWNDRGGWMSWKQLCKNVEEDLYAVYGDDFWHPRPKNETADAEAEAESQVLTTPDGDAPAEAEMEPATR
ncbi:hypothetical protein CLAFUW4_13941 [Fulvia fulva]|uniref:Uncharacterized protein n=1 Tax=Passalora fulva TaxID=5499 RepID=A0A9Q8UW77_PASFU|nr:uncharacterized protein CLAFUR5_13782 [Fulvia fulva]KAK4610214.1 hypothetical protein CLAFUR4_13944 [Fulvia fulva]KAK4611054.1 hypothetical protein CLAFUR0_13948 [Fulvia fulva]UJO24759.1 hypothetical protein CLAFUR5_13782 [Fulvia fulva]WPV21864.1 hypothetical protein CLAFUW4_13941 [Fulvia fulva]WPV36712.1 hypothetical protein CLAFUW7_13949 [Fulvia fulva]